ncbi:MAG: MtrB/PioB family outer membrane beta-barrel protein [Acidobacteria bacterium]|nr:MtrB/PioB family outer membrane beta-barrel protein [Acidobacteriota bacterium]
MKRNTIVTVLLACGLLLAATPLFAQTAAPAASSNWFTGKASVLLLGRDNVDSSKFLEYREVPKGVSMPVFSLAGSHNGIDYALTGQNIYQWDERYMGHADLSWLGVAFDYNSIVHNMGFNGHTLYSETAPGVWKMSAATRTYLGNAAIAEPTATRIYPFYANLLAPTLAAANSTDLTSLRQRGDVAFDLGKKLPFDLQFTYMRELKTGARGESSGDILGAISPVVAAPETMDEVTQDIGIRWAYNFKSGNVYARYNRNTYTDNLDALVIDNPFLAVDTVYTAATVPGGPAAARFSTSPDNEASRGAFGVLFKMKKQTRFSADFAMNTWTQDEAFLPYTNNSAALTLTGAPTNSTSSLPQKSFGGKINTSMYNFAFSSRPVEALSVRMKYRVYDLTNKTNRYVITGDASASPDRTFSAVTPTAEDPYGHATANHYDNSSKRFDLQASYDIKDLTLEGSYRNGKLERTSREAESGKENTYGIAAVYHANDMFGFKAMYDSYKRTADGTTVNGFQEDESEKTTKRTGLQFEFTPADKFDVGFTYYKNDRDYPNRPNRSASTPGTQAGLLNAKYDTYTVDFGYRPNERTELDFWYTYEKNQATNQWVTLVSGTTNVNNQLNYAGNDKGNSFGVNADFQIVPDKWKLSFMFTQQKIDGFMDVTSNTSGATGCCSFYIGRTTLNPAGAQDFADYDDTQWTTANLNLAYTYNAKATLSVGYAYDKYTYADAFNASSSLFPQAVLFYLQENNGNYSANVVYTKLTVRF